MKPAISLHIMAVLTNTAPIGVTRGPGFAETVNILERLIDAAARQGGGSSAGNDDRFDSSAGEQLESVPVERMERLEGVALGAVVKAPVGEHAVDVEAH